MKNSTGLFLKHGNVSKNTKPMEKIICDKEVKVFHKNIETMYYPNLFEIQMMLAFKIEL